MKRSFILLFFVTANFTFAQIPSYYSSIDFSLTGEDLKNQLSTLITNTHNIPLSYTPGVWEALKQTDLDPNDTSNQDVLLLYGFNDTDGNTATDRIRDKNLNCTTTSCDGLWNREHVYPRSLGIPNLGFENAGSDAHSLRACDSNMNTSRSNRVFEDGVGDSHITNSGNWYPGDEWKGDVARMIMYMYVRYDTQCEANNVAQSTNTYSVEMPDVFLLWNEEDPPSQYEMNRNNILENLQGNRNPFIDNPYLATIIWGGGAALNTWVELSLNEVVKSSSEMRIFPNPFDDWFGVSNIGNGRVELYSLDGKLIQLSNNGLINNLNSLRRGVYYVLVHTDTETIKLNVLKR